MSPEELQFFIRYTRRQNGCSQKKMAERLGISPEQLRVYELGHEEPESD